MFKGKQPFEENVRESFAKMKGELSEHLDSINENTSEIQSNFEYLQEVEAKVDKLNEKFDKILSLIEEEKPQREVFTVEPLTLREQEIFIALYTKEQSLSYLQISHRTGLPTDLIKQLTQSLISKGVPIIKRYIDDDLKLEIDSEFKETQAKTNMLQLNEQIMQHMVYEQ